MSPGQGCESGSSMTSPVKGGQDRPRPNRGGVDQVQQQRREVLTPCMGHNSDGGGIQRRD